MTMSKLDEEAFKHDLETLPKQELLKKYPAARLHKDTELIIDVLGEEIGRVRADLCPRLDAVEASLDDRKTLVVAVREHRLDCDEQI